MEYPAVIEREGKFVLAEFPDCPGCQTFVEDGSEIEGEAKDALFGWLESNLGRNLIPPKPSHILGNGRNVIRVPVEPLLAIRLQLRWARAEESLTQEKLAEKVGMSQQQLARLESGESNPTVRTIARVAQGLGRRVVMKLEKSADANFGSHITRRVRRPKRSRVRGPVGRESW